MLRIAILILLLIGLPANKPAYQPIFGSRSTQVAAENYMHPAPTTLPTDEEAEKITWSPDYNLSWADFEAAPDSTRTYIAALTSSAVAYSHFCHEGELQVKVKAVFRKKESWVRPEAKTPHYLRHEKLHFDITELHARKVRQMLHNRCFTCLQTDDLNAAIDTILQTWRKTDKQYDYQTHFSHHPSVQQAWEQKVDSLLLQHNAYSY